MKQIDWEPSLSIALEAAELAYRELDTPLSLKLALLVRNGDFVQVAKTAIDPRQYLDEKSLSRDFAATELLRKFGGLPGTSPADRRGAALKAARAAELRCAATNSEVLSWAHGSGDPGVVRTLSGARRKIRRVLQDFDLSELMSCCRWSNGSDALNKRPYVTHYHKYENPLGGTRSVGEFLACYLDNNALWSRWLSGTEDCGAFTPLFEVIQGNSYTTVPKTALTDRSICVEPPLNIFFQLGVGTMIRRRLKARAGIDLNSQEVNQWYALLGSYDSEWCTIDLSSASDTVARRLVTYLLSDSAVLLPWLRVMEALRSPFTYFPKWAGGEKWLNHKFSSMGNGFTFELETLIFWALCSSAAEEAGGVCSAVYGDDIIVDSVAYDPVVEILQTCGFEVNTKKSFKEGLFRESCGMNAFNGYSIPSYRLECWDDISDAYSFHNGLRRLGLSRAAKHVINKIPRRYRFFGPTKAGDSVLHNPDITTWNYKLHGLQDQWFFWGMEIPALTKRSVERQVRWLEPAILNSFSTLVPTGDHPVYAGGRWGSGGTLVLPDTGNWEVGRVLLSRDAVCDRIEVPGALDV